MKVVLIILCFILIIACNSEDKVQSDNKKSVATGQNNLAVSNVQTNDIQPGISKVDEKLDYPKNKKPLSPEILAKFMAEKIPGMNRIPGSKGLQNWNGKLCATASYEYIYDNGGLIVTLKDYGCKENIPKQEIEDFEKFSEPKTKEFTKVNVPYGKGFMQFLDVSRSGYLYGLVADRFIFKLDATNLPKNIYALYDLIGYINLKDLITKAKEQTK